MFFTYSSEIPNFSWWATESISIINLTQSPHLSRAAGLPHQFFCVFPKAINFPKDDLAWERTTANGWIHALVFLQNPQYLTFEYRSWKFYLLQTLSLVNQRKRVKEAENGGGGRRSPCFCLLSLDFLINWYATGHIHSMYELSTLYAGEFCWDSKGIKEIEIRWFYWFWCSN